MLVTRRASDGLQLSPVSVIAGDHGTLVTTSSSVTAKVRNIRRDPRVALCVVDDSWFGPWVSIEGRAEVLELPEAWEPLKRFHFARDGGIAGYDETAEADEWLRETWLEQKKVVVRIHPERFTTAPTWEDTLAAAEADGDVPA